MRYLLLLIFMVVSLVASSQPVVENETIERAGYYSILHHKYNTEYLMNSIELSNEYRVKARTNLLIGGGLLATSAALYVKGLSIHPVYQIGNPELNSIADDMKAERTTYLLGATAVGLAGSYFTLRGISLGNKAKLTLSSHYAMVSFSLYGN